LNRTRQALKIKHNLGLVQRLKKKLQILKKVKQQKSKKNKNYFFCLKNQNFRKSSLF
jgi:transcription initiation factor IIE alpha subunit